MRITDFRIKYESAESEILPNIYYKILPLKALLPLKASIKLKQGKFIWKSTQNQHSGCIQAIYRTNSTTEVNNNEDSNRFILPSFRTNFGRASIAYQGIKLWNKEIPETIKKSRKKHFIL